jgi:hypothetical protein
MVGNLTSIIRELGEVQDRLLALSDHATDEKLELLGRREELQTRAAQLADSIDEDGSIQDLLGQLASLRRQRAALERQRALAAKQTPGFRSPSGTMSPGTMGPRGRPTTDSVLRIEERIRRITLLLEQRGIALR